MAGRISYKDDSANQPPDFTAGPDTPASQPVRKRQLGVIFSVSPRTIDGWISKRMIPYIEPNPRLHLFDPVAVKSALLAQFAVPANMAEAVAQHAALQQTS